MDISEVPDMYTFIEHNLCEIVSVVKNINMYLTKDIELEKVVLRVLSTSTELQRTLEIISTLYKDYALGIDFENNIEGED